MGFIAVCSLKLVTLIAFVICEAFERGSSKKKQKKKAKAG